ncbi:helix-turn-helix domain-containing protein [Sinorhizobium medicae]|uniref:helix-turn-helix domain-containing protein n=2 Tax=Sinorhizobium medicae TaxID=110321 RepID=UPI000FDA59BA|nr:helix-turn-helix domain-containing protein [Sinorhizobium medicae]RVJ83912.1 helix-turn-helix domain-containing protein [Sinorhizobium medicae]WQO45661.1 helix-turn-helix domain-containing protein [Sinorhizobium medicae]
MRNFAASKLDLLDRMSVDARLSATDFRVAYRLLHYTDAATGDCFPKQETIAVDLGVTDRTIRKALANLRAYGWLEVGERPLPRGRGKSNFYHFQDATTGTRIPAKGATTGNSARDFRKKVSGASNKEHVEKNTLNRECAPRARAMALPDNFLPDLRVALAAGLDLAEAERQAAMFLDYYRAKGKPMRDWNAAWRNWIRRVPDFARRSNDLRHQQQHGTHIAEQALEATFEAFASEQSGGLFNDSGESADESTGYLPPRFRH